MTEWAEGSYYGPKHSEQIIQSYFHFTANRPSQAKPTLICCAPMQNKYISTTKCNLQSEWAIFALQPDPPQPWHNTVNFSMPCLEGAWFSFGHFVCIFTLVWFDDCGMYFLNLPSCCGAGLLLKNPDGLLFLWAHLWWWNTYLLGLMLRSWISWPCSKWLDK